MNALSPAPMSQAVIDNEDLLRHIAANPASDRMTIAKALDRRSDNMARTLAKLTEDGLLTGAEAPSLADAGRRALAALDVYAGRAAPADGVVQLAHHQIVPDPDNARTDSGLDEDSLAELADTIDRETMLQPPMVRRVDPAVGLYQLVYGERRWRAWGLLIAAGRWPADKFIACRLATGDKAQADLVALIENLQRTDIDNLEAGESFLRVARAHNMSPQNIAARIGKDPRFVQIAMQVAENATAEDKQAYRASQASYAATKAKRTYTWTRLRESVREHEDRPALQLDPKAAAALGEIWLIAGQGDPAQDPFAPLVRDIVTAQLLDLTTRGLARFAWCEGVKGLEPIVTTDVRDWLAAIGFNDDPEAAVERLQAAVVGEMIAHRMRAHGEFVTPVFNQPDPAPAEARPPPPPPQTMREREGMPPIQGEPYAPPSAVEPPEIEDPPPPASAEPEDSSPAPRAETGDDFSRQIRAANAEAAAEARIPPMQRLILIELRHALLNAPTVLEATTGDRGVDFGGEFWTDTAAQALVGAGLIITLQGADDGPAVVLLTDPGDKALAALGVDTVPTPADLDKARRDAHWPRADGAIYSTAWLNPPPATAPANPVRDPFPMPFQVILIRSDEDRAARANGEAYDVTALGMTDREAAENFAEDLIAAALAVEVEVRAADGELLFQIDNTGAA